jgi:hypothetical protein
VLNRFVLRGVDPAGRVLEREVEAVCEAHAKIAAEEAGLRLVMVSWRGWQGEEESSGEGEGLRLRQDAAGRGQAFG